MQDDLECRPGRTSARYGIIAPWNFPLLIATLPAYKVAGTRAIRVNTADLDALFVPINGGAPA